MPKELVISASPHETRVAILEDGQLCEIYIEREKEFALVGSIYKGRVTRVLPGMQSAFVDIGLDSDAFLYVGDFFENLEDYDHAVTTVEGKAEKMEQQGGTVFTQPAPGDSAAEEPAAKTALADETGKDVAEAPEDQPTATGPESGAQGSAEPSPGVRPPSTTFQRQDRGPGGFGGGQGDRRGERAGRRRGGRWRRGGGGDRRPDRELPPSKYASSRPDAPRPYQPSVHQPPEDYEPVILPGESLAKYKDRIPAASAAAPAGSAEESAPVVSEAASAAVEVEFDLSPQPAAHSDAEVFSEYQALPEEPPRGVLEPHHEPVEVSASPSNGADLSEEDVTSLAEQLAEARHEEAAAEPATGERSEGQEDGKNAQDAEAPEEAASPEDAAPGIQQSEDLPAVAPAVEAAGEVLEAEPGEDGNRIEPGRPQQPQPTSARIHDSQRPRFQRPMRRRGRHRGRHPMRPHDRQPQPERRPQLISEMLKAGQEIIVQIAKEPLGKKGARITSHVALPGRFLVYMPTVNHIGVSRRIASAEGRSRLRHLVTESKGAFPGGFIVRTAAERAPDEEIRNDVEFLGRDWEKIRTQAEPRKAPALLHHDLNLIERILRDYLSGDYTAIWIDNEEEFSKVVEFVGRFQPQLVSRVKLFTKPVPIFEEFGIQQELDRALRPKVWLKSGGYIVINHTEALVAIDVNTGKYVGRGSTRLEDTIVKTNLEAVKEIVRQIRLRDLGGIIILDFIDMEERRNRDKVMAALDDALRADHAPSKTLSFNEFGLVAVTRKRTKQALERVLCQPCPYCSGSGMVKSAITICYEIQAEARKMAADLDATSITLRVNSEIAKALKTRESALIDELEQITSKSVIIQADPTLHWEQYDIY